MKLLLLSRVAVIIVASQLLFFRPAMAQDAQESALWEKLKSGQGMVIAMRHTEVTNGPSAVHFDASGNCQGEVMLSDKGHAQARKIGELFASHGIKPTVVHSPMCRVKETVRLAFGGLGVYHDDLREIASADAVRRQQFLKTATSLLKLAAGKQVVVFVGHAPNLAEITMEQFAYGIGLVGNITKDGEIEGIGRVKLY
jgi:Histidine phosphatase superfamily (branch 1)